jgi:membrane protein implicated in regulation of membrane protease activity
MEWFSVWWNSLGLAGQIMAVAAIPMTVVMFLQLILMLFGYGTGSDADTDSDGDCGDAAPDNTSYEAGSNNSSGFSKIFTVRGIVAFFALGGWAGLAALSAGIPLIWSIQISLLSGVAALMLASIVIRLALRMQDSGNLNLKHALAQTAEVYITIPPLREKTGKVMVLMQERLVELEAVTDSDTAIKPNTKVEVVGIADNERLIVRPIEKHENKTVEEENNE